MNRVEGMVVVEITTIETATVDGRNLTRTRKKKVEVTEERASTMMDEYPDTSNLPAGVESDGIKYLGQAYETTEEYNGKPVRVIYGEKELGIETEEKPKRGKKK